MSLNARAGATDYALADLDLASYCVLIYAETPDPSPGKNMQPNPMTVLELPHYFVTTHETPARRFWPVGPAPAPPHAHALMHSIDLCGSPQTE